MMRDRRVVALFALLAIVGTQPASAGGNANFLFGSRTLGDEEFWDQDQDQTVAGVMVDFGRQGWPIHIALSNMDSSSCGDCSQESTVSEYAIGIVKVWEPKGTIRPFVGAGAAAVRAIFSEEAGGADLVRHDTTSAFYFDGGVFWRTGRRFNIGLGTRLMSLARMEIGGTRFDANYLQVHALAGFGWPRREKPAVMSAPEEP